MLGNYLKVAWRFMLKSRLTSAINITGLVVGIGGVVIIGAFVLDEFQYDQHFTHIDRIYRLSTTSVNQGSVFHSAMTSAHVAPTLVRALPEVASTARMMPTDEGFLFNGQTAFKEKIIYTDSAFVRIFDLDMLLGNPDACLKRPSSVIISERTATKIFGSAWRGKAILGEILAIDNRIPLTITGVFSDLPDLTHFTSGLFASVPSGLGWMRDESKVYTYVLLHERANPKTFYRNIASADLLPAKGSEKVSINAQPLGDIHLFSSLEDDQAIRGNIKNIYALISVALFLIFITSTNFANLYTARCFNRLKEVGVRKAIGAFPRQLRFQFLAETLLITMLAAVIALIAVAAFLPLFNEIAGKHFSIRRLFTPGVFALMAALIVGISAFTSFYPSLFLSGTRTIEALKGVKGSGLSAGGLRKSLIVFQFAISAVTILVSMVAFRQVDLIRNKPLGFDKEHTVALANPYMLGSTEKVVALRNELSAVSGVENVSVTGYTPSQNRWENQRMTFPAGEAQSSRRQIANWLTVDEAFVPTMGLTMVAGRNFVEDDDADSTAIIVNEKAAAGFGLTDPGNSAVGSRLSFRNEDGNEARYTVVGVIRDFNFGSLHEPVRPVILRKGHHRFEMVLRLSPAWPQQDILSRAEAVWRKHLPVIPFQYTFIRDRFDHLHKPDIAASKLFSTFCLVTVVMSALGLFSMVTYTIAGRTKEIGIRKLLGASGGTIVFLLSREFILLIMASYAVALPIAGALAGQWLSDFAYKVEITWTMHAVTGLILLLVTAITLGYQSVKAASMNPVDSLRNE